jgi:hypothetical protein
MPTSEREVGKAGRSSSTQSTNGRWKGCGGRIEVGEAHARIAVGMKLPRERGNLGVAFEPMQSAASTYKYCELRDARDGTLGSRKHKRWASRMHAYSTSSRLGRRPQLRPRSALLALLGEGKGPLGSAFWVAVSLPKTERGPDVWESPLPGCLTSARCALPVALARVHVPACR